ncbi:DEAD/DEAH box helicase [Anatilimnocola sp. NA78]|uniref:DEAD/DEAH box helicase n=1 Tax=Anatilimnocola sp. NA78 TaxID=3415683 RepID=UPI003CE56B29
MTVILMKYPKLFKEATGNDPYPYQLQLAIGEQLPVLLSVPTGVGKTAAVILGWLYRRCFAARKISEQTPRRLVYCLPMRSLVEQTKQCADAWLSKLIDCGHLQPNDVSAHLLMGGADDTHWDEFPERNSILIGTQDMLLSRALNRGYGMSRYRWPMHFGLLNNDSLWVMDETQLMGVGLTTTAQMQGFRGKLGTVGTCDSLWMSATLDTGPLETIDHPKPEEGFRLLRLGEEDLADEKVQQRIESVKPLEKIKPSLSPDSDGKSYRV